MKAGERGWKRWVIDDLVQAGSCRRQAALPARRQNLGRICCASTRAFRPALHMQQRPISTTHRIPRAATRDSAIVPHEQCCAAAMSSLPPSRQTSVAERRTSASVRHKSRPTSTTISASEDRENRPESKASVLRRKVNTTHIDTKRETTSTEALIRRTTARSPLKPTRNERRSQDDGGIPQRGMRANSTPIREKRAEGSSCRLRMCARMPAREHLLI